MSNGTGNTNSEAMRDQLNRLVRDYRDALRSDERQLLEAMREFERSCWADFLRHTA